jgi:hypothetical protein
MKRSEGDFMTLLNVMNEILSIRKSVSPKQFDLRKVCRAKNLLRISHLFNQALRRYINLEKAFDLSNDHRQSAQVRSGDWEMIGKALLVGYGENVFVSMKELQGKTHCFTRYCSGHEDLAVLDLQSTLLRSMSTAPVSLVLARDIRFSSSIRATAVLSFIGEIQSDWIEYDLTRQIVLNTAEETKLNNERILTIAQQTFFNVDMKLSNHTVTLQGPAGAVLSGELDILRKLVVDLKFTLDNQYASSDNANYDRMKRNLESVTKMPRIFNPMKWRWEAQRQVKIMIDHNTINQTCSITIRGRDSQNQLVKKEFESFLGWLKNSAVIRHPNSGECPYKRMNFLLKFTTILGVSPRILKPQMRPSCLDIEQRISHITDSKRTSIELWKSLKGSNAIRETRMEVVAWLAVCRFDCRLEGGFVRDWIVDHHRTQLAGGSSAVTFTTNPAGFIIPNISKDLIPTDLDFHLPSHKYFDIDKFLDALHRHRIECRVFREDWRYILLLDENAKTGPFTMDLIEPHVALTHDRIDFDVSNLSLEKDYTKELGMRVDIQQKPYSIEIEMIVDNIKKKRFHILRPLDHNCQHRLSKMIQRGWTQIGEPMHVIPDPPPKYHVVLISLPESTALYKSLVSQMQSSISHQLRVLSIEEIKNPLLQDTYLAMKQMIAKQCPGRNPNERELFHGTKGDAIDGILNDGYDDRYWGANFATCNWG